MTGNERLPRTAGTRDVRQQILSTHLAMPFRPAPALRQKRGQDAPGRGISPYQDEERPCPTGSLS